MIALMIAAGGFLLGWVGASVYHSKHYEEAVNHVHNLDDENRRLTENILELHRQRRLENQGKVAP